MINLPEKIKGITHSQIHSVYLKKEYGYNKKSQDVLVIEAKKNISESKGEKSFYELLKDLQSIKIQAEESVGYFDRVDIVTH